MSQNIMCREKYQSRHTPAAITLVGSDESFVILSILFFFVQFYFYCSHSFVSFPSVESPWATYFFLLHTISLHRWTYVEHNKKSTRNTNFRSKLFWFNIYSFFFLVDALEGIICLCRDCVHINIVRLAATHLCFRLHIVCRGKQEKYFDVLQIYCSVGFISCARCCCFCFFFTLSRLFCFTFPQVTLTWRSAAIKKKISHSVRNGDAKLKTKQNEIKMVNGTCSCLLPLHHPFASSFLAKEHKNKENKHTKMKCKHEIYSNSRLGKGSVFQMYVKKWN